MHINCNDDNNNNIEHKCYKKNSNLIDNNHYCIKCGKNYYIKNNDILNNNTYINCYKAPNGFYIDSNEEYPSPKPCYSLCETCEKEGNEINNNCNECKEGYSPIEIDRGYFNCYNIVRSDGIVETTQLIENVKYYSSIVITDRKKETELIKSSIFYRNEISTENKLETQLMTNKNILSSNISQSIIIKTTNNFYSNEIKTENKIEPQIFTNKNIFSAISQSIMKEINNNYYSNEITTKDKIITNINTFFIDNASSEFETELIIVENNINILINNFNKTKIDEGIDM